MQQGHMPEIMLRLAKVSDIVQGYPRCDRVKTGIVISVKRCQTNFKLPFLHWKQLPITEHFEQKESAQMVGYCTSELRACSLALDCPT